MKTTILAVYLRLSKPDTDIQLNEKRESNSISNQRLLIKDFLSFHLLW